MKVGTLILAINSTPSENKVALRVKEYLLSKERKNVFIGYHNGTPDCYEIFLEMNRQGIDTYCILPLTVAEGNLTIWDMPKHLSLPDNSGSWTMIGNHDVATRFSTALGCEPSIGIAMEKELGEPEPDVGVVVMAHGSKLSLSEKTAEYYAEYLRNLGWNAVTAFARHEPRTTSEAENLLKEKGCTSLKVVPLFITAEGASYKESLSKLSLPFTVIKPLSEYPEFYEILNSKVPEDW